MSVKFPAGNIKEANTHPRRVARVFLRSQLVEQELMNEPRLGHSRYDTARQHLHHDFPDDVSLDFRVVIILGKTCP